MYFVDFRTGANKLMAHTLDEARVLAKENIAYTQESIVIYDGDKPVLISFWRPHPYTDSTLEGNLQDFGKYGYYSNWYDYD